MRTINLSDISLRVLDHWDMVVEQVGGEVDARLDEWMQQWDPNASDPAYQEFCRQTEAEYYAEFPDQRQPTCCPLCRGELNQSTGYVGEDVLYCPNDNCTQGICWEDCDDAIQRVI